MRTRQPASALKLGIDIIRTMFRDYKRHYHKVQKVASRLADGGGSFGLQIKFEGKSLSVQNTTPNEEETVRFVVLMRRFLSPSDSLYFKNVWSFILPSSIYEDAERYLELNGAGHFGYFPDFEGLRREHEEYKNKGLRESFRRVYSLP